MECRSQQWCNDERNLFDLPEEILVYFIIARLTRNEQFTFRLVCCEARKYVDTYFASTTRELVVCSNWSDAKTATYAKLFPNVSRLIVVNSIAWQLYFHKKGEQLPSHATGEKRASLFPYAIPAGSISTAVGSSWDHDNYDEVYDGRWYASSFSTSSCWSPSFPCSSVSVDRYNKQQSRQTLQRIIKRLGCGEHAFRNVDHFVFMPAVEANENDVSEIADNWGHRLNSLHLKCSVLEDENGAIVNILAQKFQTLKVLTISGTIRQRNENNTGLTSVTRSSLTPSSSSSSSSSPTTTTTKITTDNATSTTVTFPMLEELSLPFIAYDLETVELGFWFRLESRIDSTEDCDDDDDDDDDDNDDDGNESYTFHDDSDSDDDRREQRMPNNNIKLKQVTNDAEEQRYILDRHQSYCSLIRAAMSKDQLKILSICTMRPMEMLGLYTKRLDELTALDRNENNNINKPNSDHVFNVDDDDANEKQNNFVYIPYRFRSLQELRLFLFDVEADEANWLISNDNNEENEKRAGNDWLQVQACLNNKQRRDYNQDDEEEDDEHPKMVTFPSLRKVWLGYPPNFKQPVLHRLTDTLFRSFALSGYKMRRTFQSRLREIVLSVEHLIALSLEIQSSVLRYHSQSLESFAVLNAKLTPIVNIHRNQQTEELHTAFLLRTIKLPELKQVTFTSFWERMTLVNLEAVVTQFCEAGAAIIRNRQCVSKSSRTDRGKGRSLANSRETTGSKLCEAHHTSDDNKNAETTTATSSARLKRSKLLTGPDRGEVLAINLLFVVNDKMDLIASKQDLLHTKRIVRDIFKNYNATDGLVIRVVIVCSTNDANLKSLCDFIAHRIDYDSLFDVSLRLFWPGWHGVDNISGSRESTDRLRFSNGTIGRSATTRLVLSKEEGIFEWKTIYITSEKKKAHSDSKYVSSCNRNAPLTRNFLNFGTDKQGAVDESPAFVSEKLSGKRRVWLY